MIPGDYCRPGDLQMMFLAVLGTGISLVDPIYMPIIKESDLIK